MALTWLEHVKNTMKEYPEKSFKEILMLAKKTWKKVSSTAKYAVTGKKSRKARKSHKKSGKKAHKKAGKKSRKARKSRRR